MFDSKYKDSIRINRKWSKSYFEALLAVYNAKHLAASDTVVTFLNIHSYNPGMCSLIVRADSNLLWMRKLSAEIIPSGDMTVDHFMQRYELKKTFYSALLQPNTIVFKSDSNYNLFPLAHALRLRPGISSAEVDCLFGEGNDITDSVATDYIDLTYKYTWEDCPVRCGKKRFWKFRIYNDHKVEYIESYGDPLDPALRLSVEEGEDFFSDVKVYPNPSKDKLYIESPQQNTPEFKLTITNTKGTTVYALDKFNTRDEIDLVFFANGTYFLRLENRKYHKLYRIVKNLKVIVPEPEENKGLPVIQSKKKKS
jgi:hypothetical protein